MPIHFFWGTAEVVVFLCLTCQEQETAMPESVRSGLDTQRPTAMKVTNVKRPPTGRRALSRHIVLPPIRALGFIWQWHYLVSYHSYLPTCSDDMAITSHLQLSLVVALALVIATATASFSYVSMLQKKDEFGSRQYNDMLRKCYVDPAYPIQISK